MPGCGPKTSCSKSRSNIFRTYLQRAPISRVQVLKVINTEGIALVMLPFNIRTNMQLTWVSMVVHIRMTRLWTSLTIIAVQKDLSMTKINQVSRVAVATLAVAHRLTPRVSTTLYHLLIKMLIINKMAALWIWKHKVRVPNLLMKMRRPKMVPREQRRGLLAQRHIEKEKVVVARPKMDRLACIARAVNRLRLTIRESRITRMNARMMASRSQMMRKSASYYVAMISRIMDLITRIMVVLYQTCLVPVAPPTTKVLWALTMAILVMSRWP